MSRFGPRSSDKAPTSPINKFRPQVTEDPRMSAHITASTFDKTARVLGRLQDTSPDPRLAMQKSISPLKARMPSFGGPSPSGMGKIAGTAASYKRDNNRDSRGGDLTVSTLFNEYGMDTNSRPLSARYKGGGNNSGGGGGSSMGSAPPPYYQDIHKSSRYDDYYQQQHQQQQSNSSYHPYQQQFQPQQPYTMNTYNSHHFINSSNNSNNSNNSNISSGSNNGHGHNYYNNNSNNINSNSKSYNNSSSINKNNYNNINGGSRDYSDQQLNISVPAVASPKIESSSSTDQPEFIVLNLQQSPRWYSLSVSLWAILVGANNRGRVDRVSVINVLDVIVWRATAKITEDEFSILFSEFLKSSSKKSSNSSSSSNISSNSSSNSIIDVHAMRQILMERRHTENDIDLFIGICVNEMNRTMVGSTIIKTVSLSANHHTDVEMVNTNYIQLCEELFFQLDTSGHGLLQFDEMMLLSTLIMIGVVNTSCNTVEEIELDINVSNVVANTLQLMVNMGASPNIGYHIADPSSSSLSSSLAATDSSHSFVTMQMFKLYFIKTGISSSNLIILIQNLKQLLENMSLMCYSFAKDIYSSLFPIHPSSSSSNSEPKGGDGRFASSKDVLGPPRLWQRAVVTTLFSTTSSSSSSSGGNNKANSTPILNFLMTDAECYVTGCFRGSEQLLSSAGSSSINNINSSSNSRAIVDDANEIVLHLIKGFQTWSYYQKPSSGADTYFNHLSSGGSGNSIPMANYKSNPLFNVFLTVLVEYKILLKRYCAVLYDLTLRYYYKDPSSRLRQEDGFEDSELGRISVVMMPNIENMLTLLGEVDHLSSSVIAAATLQVQSATSIGKQNNQGSNNGQQSRSSSFGTASAVSSASQTTTQDSAAAMAMAVSSGGMGTLLNGHNRQSNAPVNSNSNNNNSNSNSNSNEFSGSNVGANNVNGEKIIGGSGGSNKNAPPQASNNNTAGSGQNAPSSASSAASSKAPKPSNFGKLHLKPFVESAVNERSNSITSSIDASMNSTSNNNKNKANSNSSNKSGNNNDNSNNNRSNNGNDSKYNEAPNKISIDPREDRTTIALIPGSGKLEVVSSTPESDNWHTVFDFRSAKDRNNDSNYDSAAHELGKSSSNINNNSSSKSRSNSNGNSNSNNVINEERLQLMKEESYLVDQLIANDDIAMQTNLISRLKAVREKLGNSINGDSKIKPNVNTVDLKDSNRSRTQSRDNSNLGLCSPTTDTADHMHFSEMSGVSTTPSTIAELLEQGQDAGKYAQSLREILRKMSKDDSQVQLKSLQKILKLGYKIAENEVIPANSKVPMFSFNESDFVDPKHSGSVNNNNNSSSNNLFNSYRSIQAPAVAPISVPINRNGSLGAAARDLKFGKFSSPIRFDSNGGNSRNPNAIRLNNSQNMHSNINSGSGAGGGTDSARRSNNNNNNITSYEYPEQLASSSRMAARGGGGNQGRTMSAGRYSNPRRTGDYSMNNNNNNNSSNTNYINNFSKSKSGSNPAVIVRSTGSSVPGTENLPRSTQPRKAFGHPI